MNNERRIYMSPNITNNEGFPINRLTELKKSSINYKDIGRNGSSKIQPDQRFLIKRKLDYRNTIGTEPREIRRNRRLITEEGGSGFKLTRRNFQDITDFENIQNDKADCFDEYSPNREKINELVPKVTRLIEK
mmetsp:Transcript_29065/g.25706  ORF Transcript_29065/g.25706 Transcript_29065/m.25706 type:complete len:133 (+) Transcript_29065:195-593(+)